MIVQPSVGKRIAFATWARKNGINRHSSATFVLSDLSEVPEALLKGAQVDGKPYDSPQPKTTRKRVRKAPVGPVEEPSPSVPEPENVQEPYVQRYERQQAEAQAESETQED